MSRGFASPAGAADSGPRASRAAANRKRCPKGRALMGCLPQQGWYGGGAPGTGAHGKAGRGRRQSAAPSRLTRAATISRGTSPAAKESRMTGKDAIKTALQGTRHVLNWYLADLSDADLL